jgi:hypothetical protein
METSKSILQKVFYKKFEKFYKDLRLYSIDIDWGNSPDIALKDKSLK